MSTTTKHTILAVEGMTCGSCVRHVDAALRRLDGIAAVEVRLKDGRVHVDHDERASDPAMIEALGEAGYRARLYDAAARATMEG